MCGILGILDLGAGLDAALYARFAAGFGFMYGRGPDGYWIYGDDHLVMGQSVLQITDPAGDIKPYVSNDRNIIACANGEIYNSADLRRQLERDGADFVTDSDCEVLSHGYAHWQDQLFERLDGMFAIAIFNRTTQTLTIARDRVGIRPLYYTLKSGGYLAFASEPRMLTGAGLARKDLSPTGHFQALLLRRPMEPHTMYKEVHAVLPGQLMRICRATGSLRSETFAAMPIPVVQATQEVDSQRQQRLIQTLAQAVAKRIPERCNYSLFLSGGLDSSIVNYLTPPDTKKRLPSLVAGFSFAHGIDERALAQRAAPIVKTRLLCRSLDLETFLALWPLLVWLADEPLMFNSSVPLFALCREARRLGAKVILSGEGADEMFVGYSQYPAYQQERDDGSPDYLFKHDQEIIPLATAKDWAQDDAWFEQQWAQLQAQIDTMLHIPSDSQGLERKLELDRITFMRGLLMRQDRVGLNAGIEVRVPFLDVQVMQLANAYASSQHLENGVGKKLLRDAFEPLLGRALTQIPKIGFPLPLPVWLLEPDFRRVCLALNDQLNASGLVKSDAILKIMSSSSSYSATSYRHIWTLLNLALWWVNSQTDEIPPHGVWARLIPPRSLAYVEEVVQESCRPFARNFLFDALNSGPRPAVLHAKGWESPRVARLEALFEPPARSGRGG